MLEQRINLAYEQGAGAVLPAVEEVAALLGLQGRGRCTWVAGGGVAGLAWGWQAGRSGRAV